MYSPAFSHLTCHIIAITVLVLLLNTFLKYVFRLALVIEEPTDRLVKSSEESPRYRCLEIIMWRLLYAALFPPYSALSFLDCVLCLDVNFQ